MPASKLGIVTLTTQASDQDCGQDHGHSCGCPGEADRFKSESFPESTGVYGLGMDIGCYADIDGVPVQ